MAASIELRGQNLDRKIGSSLSGSLASARNPMNTEIGSLFRMKLLLHRSYSYWLLVELTERACTFIRITHPRSKRDLAAFRWSLSHSDWYYLVEECEGERIGFCRNIAMWKSVFSADNYTKVTREAS